MDEPTYAVCVRVADLDNPIEGSTVDTCGECGAEVWIGAAARLFVQDEGATILCAPCGLAQMQRESEENGGFEIVTNDLQRREIEREWRRRRL